MRKTHKQQAAYHARKAANELTNGSAVDGRGHLTAALVSLASNGYPLTCLWEYPSTFDDNRGDWDDFQRLQIRKWFLRSTWVAFRYYRTEEDDERERQRQRRSAIS